MSNYTKQDYERDLIITNSEAPSGWTHSSLSSYFKLGVDGAYCMGVDRWISINVNSITALRSRVCIENQIAMYEANQKLIAKVLLVKQKFEIADKSNWFKPAIFGLEQAIEELTND